ncbi:hypothetical protein V6N13_047097 [Hibiscus sabdariffa]
MSAELVYDMVLRYSKGAGSLELLWKKVALIVCRDPVNAQQQVTQGTLQVTCLSIPCDLDACVIWVATCLIGLNDNKDLDRLI